MTKIQPLLTWRGAICESGLPATARHVALTLSLYMSERGDSAFPGAKRLARDTGLTERSVRDQLARLTAGGWLQLVEKGGIKGEKRHANQYAARVPETALPLDQGTTFTREGDSPVNVDAPTPEPHDTQPLNDVQPISSVELSKNSPSRAAINDALALLVERDVERGKPDDPRGYRVACRKERREDGTLGILNDLAGEHPEWSAVELADACDGMEPCNEPAKKRTDIWCHKCGHTGDHWPEDHDLAFGVAS